MPTNILSAFNVEVWSSLVIQKLYQRNVAMMVAANTDYEGDVQRAGSTVYVRTYGRVSWGSYSKGQPINYQELASAKEPLVVNDAEYFAFMLDDLDKAQADLPLEEPYTREAAISLSELIDTKIFSYYTSAHASNVIGTAGAPITLAGTGTGVTTWDQIVTMNQRLDAMNVPSEGRWAIVGADFKAWVAKDQTLIKALAPIAGTVLSTARPGMTSDGVANFLGNLGGIDLYWSNNLPKPATGVTANIFGQGRPISYASKFREVETIRLQDTFASAVRGLILHDGKVFSEHSKRLGVLYTN